MKNMQQQAKALVNKKEAIFTLTKFVVLVGVVSLAPLIRQQAISGPIVNATLLISVVLLGLPGAILVGLSSSLIALSVGLLPVVLAPMIPFIMAGNAILVVAFGCLRKRNYWLGMISAGILKFLFLFGTSYVVVNLILKEEIAQKAAQMMSWPQLVTALAGGFIAYLFLKGIKKI